MKPLDVSSLRKFEASLRTLPKKLAIDIAERAAPILSAFSRDTFESGQDPYGVPWAPSVTGAKVDLHVSGALRKFIRFVAIGTKLRVSLGVPYAKYQIGKRPVYPRPGVLPKKYADALATSTREAIEQHLAFRGGQ